MNAEPNGTPPGRGFSTHFMALASCILAVGSWVLLILTWTWTLTRPPGTFKDMGSLMITFYVLPLTLGAWILGGPMALALGGYAARQVRSGEGTRQDGETAGAGIFLSRLMLWGGVGCLVLPQLRACLR